MKKATLLILVIVISVLLVRFYGADFLSISEPDGYLIITESDVFDFDDTAYTELAEETEYTSQTEMTAISYTFRNEELYDSHFEKHGTEFGNITKEEYLKKANELINSESPDVLHKTEKEDGDYLFYNRKTNEFLVLSTDGYIRTYFKPDDGIDYWERQ